MMMDKTYIFFESLQEDGDIVLTGKTTELPIAKQRKTLVMNRQMGLQYSLSHVHDPVLVIAVKP